MYYSSALHSTKDIGEAATAGTKALFATCTFKFREFVLVSCYMFAVICDAYVSLVAQLVC